MTESSEVKKKLSELFERFLNSDAEARKGVAKEIFEFGRENQSAALTDKTLEKPLHECLNFSACYTEVPDARKLNDEDVKKMVKRLKE